MHQKPLTNGRIALIQALSNPLLLRKNARQWLLASGCFVFLIFLFPILSHRGRPSAQILENQIAIWEQQEAHHPTHFAKIEEGLKHSKTNSKQFASRIAQQLLFTGQDELAVKYVQEVLQHAREHPPPLWYTHFSTATYCIAKKNYREALELAHALKEEMDRDPKKRSNNSFLYLCNVLRTIALERELGMRSQEKKRWHEFLKLSDHPDFRQSFSTLDHYMREGSVSFQNLEN
jgi:hypothetical protein